MPKAAAATGWIGAPPECADGFAFAHGEFFAQASGQNQHRRATQAELKTHFTEGNERDHPAHWFEAQLIHYGLKASKTKAVARSRLLDAVNSGELKVPANLTALESQLKKTWTKKDKEAKSKSQGKGKAATSSVKDSASTASSSKQPAAKGGPKKETAAKTATPAKGKAASSSANSVVKGSAKKESATKTTTPARTAGVKRKAEADVENEASTKRTSAKKPTPKKINATGTAKRATGAAAASFSSPANVTKSKASARRGGGASSGPSRSLLTTDAGPGFVPRTKQTARRSGAFMARGRIPYAQSIEDYHYDPMDLDEDDSQPDISNSERDDGDSEDDDSDCGFIEVLPGRYSITCPYVSSEWPDYGSSFLLKLALDESSVWGTFDLGVISGVMRFDEIPQGRSHECIPFTWRGRENEGMIMHGDDNEGWMKFLGDGNVEGYFDYQSIEFEGIRRPGPLQTNAAALRDEWDGYSEEQYEFENRSRWG